VCARIGWFAFLVEIKEAHKTGDTKQNPTIALRQCLLEKSEAPNGMYTKNEVIL